ITLSKLRPYDYAAATPGRARGNLDLPPHAVAAGRLQLQASADLLGVRRRGDRTLRIVGRRLDDAGAAVALPALGNLGHRQRAARCAATRALVFAVALRALARRQRAVEIRKELEIARRPPAEPLVPGSHCLDALLAGGNN